MALTPTALDEWRAKENNIDYHEHRFGLYGGFALALADTDNLIPDKTIVQERTTADRTVSFAVLNKGSLSPGSARTCTGATYESTSAYVTPSWTTWNVGFQMIRSQYESNYVSYMKDFSKKMDDVQRVLLENLDTAAIAHLNTNKSTVNNASGNPYSFASGLSSVPLADNDLFLNELGSIMVANDLPDDTINILGSPRFKAYTKEWTNQGANNAENREFQFGPYSFYYSRRNTVATGNRDTVYALPPASFGFLNWIAPDFRVGSESGDGKQWSVVSMPKVGIDLELLYQSSCADKSDVVTGLEASLLEQFMFSTDYVFTSAYNSTSTNPGSIYKFGLSKS